MPGYFVVHAHEEFRIQNAEWKSRNIVRASKAIYVDLPKSPRI